MRSTLIEEITSKLETQPGSWGIIVRTHQSSEMITYHAKDYFPLASAAKVALGAVTASLVSQGDLSWNIPVRQLAWDVGEDSAVIYPHLQHLSELPLSSAVEIMMACHDHHCADAVAAVLGGWSSAGDLVQNRFQNVMIHRNARDEARNVGTLDALLGIV